MKKMKFGLLVVAVLALVAVASAGFPAYDIDGIPTYPGIATDSYWTVELLDAVNPELEAVSGYTSWCVDSNPDDPHYLQSGHTYSFDVYSSLEGGWPADMPGVSNWKKVNYILNHKNDDWEITQAAIWHFDGQSGAAYPSGTGVGGYDEDAYDEYLADVEENGGDFFPTCRAPIYAVILYDPGHQVIIIEDDYPCDNSPEFPTLALPVAMLIGVVGAVQYIKTRKE